MLKKVEEFITQYYKDFTPYKAKRWCYEDGILLKASVDLYEATKNDFYKDFVLKYLDEFVQEDGKPIGYKREEYSCDDIESSYVLFWGYEQTKSEKLKKSIELFTEHLAWQPRARCGNYFHKLRYPYQVWMDGLYMAQPFHLLTALNSENKDKEIEDIMNQFRNCRKYMYDESRHLYVHAYDETHYMQWANKETGKAPNVWSRACGWMMMALVDISELLGVNDENAKELMGMYNELVEGLIPHLDKETKMIYQVVDYPNDTDNYLETSGSSMLAYSLLKAERIGALNEKFKGLGKELFENIVSTHLVEQNGHLELTDICQVAGLDNEKRDGSRNYYYSEKRVSNEVKGVAPFFMAYSEYLKVN